MMKSIIPAFLLLVAGLTFEISARATPLSGTVKSATGQPLSQVKVLTYAPLQKQTKFTGMNMTMQRYEVLSDGNGVFRLPDHGRIIYFTQSGQRPVTKILPLAATTVQVVMEEAAATLWKVPQCSSESDKARTGIAFKVLAPDSVRIKKDVRFNLDVYYYGYQVSEGKFEAMVNWQDSTSSHPSDEMLLEAKKFTERLWVSGERLGYDVRGEKTDGMVWRYVSYRWGGLSYQAYSNEAAKAFDKMIDGMCFDEDDAKKYPNENF